MRRSTAEIIREYGPFPGADHVQGVTYDGRNVWFASAERRRRGSDALRFSARLLLLPSRERGSMFLHGLRLRELERKRPTPWLAATTRSYVMFGIGDTTEAMAALERATDANELWPASGSVLDPMFDPVRSSARFHALLRRVNLPLSEAIVGPPPVSR